MRLELVRIGNSRGIRIPKPILEECGFEDEVELQIDEGRLVIAPVRQPRMGWEEAFRAAGSSSQDEVLLEEMGLNEFDTKEWRW
jgi:antitoxin MazE